MVVDCRLVVDTYQVAFSDYSGADCENLCAEEAKTQSDAQINVCLPSVRISLGDSELKEG